MCIHIGVSKNRGGPPKSSILIGFSIIFTIHFGVTLFLETANIHIYIHRFTNKLHHGHMCVTCFSHPLCDKVLEGVLQNSKVRLVKLGMTFGYKLLIRMVFQKKVVFHRSQGSFWNSDFWKNMVFLLFFSLPKVLKLDDYKLHARLAYASHLLVLLMSGEGLDSWDSVVKLVNPLKGHLSDLRNLFIFAGCMLL